jgi:hypothetical protein
MPSPAGISERDFAAALRDIVPDARDGLTRKERVVLYVLHRTQKERGGRDVPTVMLWGRVCEYFYISPEELCRSSPRARGASARQRRDKSRAS